MANQSSLAQAIAAGLRSMAAAPPQATLQDLAEDGREALEVIQLVMNSIGDVASAAHDERKFFSLQLIRSSCEHGRAGCFLLANNPGDMAGVAMSVHRSQMEQFLRAVFVAYIADDEQLADFMDVDKGPRRKNGKGKWESIHLDDLADLVDPVMGKLGETASDGKLARMVQNAWEPLCGLVHGGRALRALYADRHGQIGCDVPADIQFQMTINAVATVNHCLVVAATLSDLPPGEQDAILQAPLDAFHGYVDRRNTRLKRLGMHDHVKELARRP